MTAVGLPDALAPASRSRFPHKPRALFGFYASAGISHGDFTRGLGEWKRSREARWPTRVGVRIEGTEDLLQGSIGASVRERITPLDGFATIDIERYHPDVADLDALVEPLVGIGDELAAIIDRERSFAMAGLVNLVVAGEGPFAMMLMCAHHPDVNLQDTHSWWCSFGEVMHQASSGHTVGYHQLQCEPELSARAAASARVSATSFDLGDLVYLSSIDEFAAQTKEHVEASVDPGPPVNQRDRFITFHGSVGAFCAMVEP